MSKKHLKERSKEVGLIFVRRETKKSENSRLILVALHEIMA